MARLRIKGSENNNTKITFKHAKYLKRNKIYKIALIISGLINLIAIVAYLN